MRVFRYRRSGFNGTNFCNGISFVIVVLGLMSFSLRHDRFPIIVVTGMGLLAIGFWNKGRAVITLHDDQLEMKVALLRRRKYVLYEEMTRLDADGPAMVPTKVWLVAGERRLRLPLNLLEPDDQRELIKELERRIRRPDPDSIRGTTEAAK